MVGTRDERRTGSGLALMRLRETPETDAAWADRAVNILEQSRKLERERDSAREALQHVAGWPRALVSAGTWLEMKEIAAEELLKT